MKQTYTLNDAARRWCELTGTPGRDIQWRMRLMRKARFLPSGAARATDELIARFMVGMLCGDTQTAAPREAQLAFDAPPEEHTINEHGSSPLFTSDFGIALTALIRTARKGGPVNFDTLMVNAEGINMGGGISLTLGGEKMYLAWQWPPQATLPAGVYSIDRMRTIPGPVVHALADLASDRVSGLSERHRIMADKIADLGREK